MTPAQIASWIARQCLREALDELRPCLEYKEQHDPRCGHAEQAYAACWSAR